MAQDVVLYQGEDSPIVFDLGTDVFADLTDVIIGVRIDKTLKKTYKKSESDAAKQVLEVEDEASKCCILLNRTDTLQWPKGLLVFEITLVYEDEDYPSGRHDTEVVPVGQFGETLTR